MRYLRYALVAFLICTCIGSGPLAQKRSMATQNAAFQQRLAQQDETLRQLISTYEQHLGIHRNPFLTTVYSAESANRLYRQMAVKRVQKGKQIVEEQSLTDKVNQALRRTAIYDDPFDDHLVETLIADSHLTLDTLLQRTLADKEARFDAQAHLFGLHLARDYLKRFGLLPQVVDRDGAEVREVEAPAPKDKPPHQPPKPQPAPPQQQDGTPPPPPGWPRLPEAYQAFTKDTDNQQAGSGAQQKPILAEVNFTTPYFGGHTFSDVIRQDGKLFFEQSSYAQMPRGVAAHRPTQRQMKVHTFGAQQIELLMPPGMQPVQPLDARVKLSAKANGTFSLQLSHPAPQLDIPLIEADIEDLSPMLHDIYTRPVGIYEDEWPALVQSELISTIKKGREHPLDIAQKVANFLATQYLYSVDSRQETDPIAALNSGAMQCDMANGVGIALLRDVYGIPCRLRCGFRAKKRAKKGDDASYLLGGDDAHVWIEVYHEGRWHLFDATPLRKDRKTEQDPNGVKDEFKDQALDNVPDIEDPNADDGMPGDDSDDGEGNPQKNGKSALKRMLENAAERLKEHKEKNGQQDDARVENHPAEDDANNVLDPDALLEEMSLGSLSLQDQTNPIRNPLADRALRTTLRDSLVPTRRGQTTQSRLSQVVSLLLQNPTPELAALIQDAKLAHKQDHPPLGDWISQIRFRTEKRSVVETYADLFQLRKSIEVYLQLLDTHDAADAALINTTRALLNRIIQAQKQLETMSAANTEGIALVDELARSVPELIQRALFAQYGIDHIGDNLPSHKAAADFKAGKLSDMRLLSLLYPATEFILNSTQRPDSEEIRTWLPTNRKSTREFLPAQSLDQAFRTRYYLGNPGKSLVENYVEGTLYAGVKRKRVQIPSGMGQEEAERITIVLYDTSGSMNGDPARFQAGLIGAFTGRALSDVSPSGRQRHKVVIIPFDTKVYPAMTVTTQEAALDIINNYKSKLRNTGGGTDIQVALTEALAQIADAQKRTNEPLAAANIILMSDGGSTVDFDALIEKRSAIDRTTPIQTLFVGINGTNHDLIRYAQQSQFAQGDESFYAEFTPTDISEILHDADHPDTEKLKKQGVAFYTSQSSQSIPRAFYATLQDAAAHADVLGEALQHHRQKRVTSERLLADVMRMTWPSESKANRPLERWLGDLRGLLHAPVYQDRELLDIATADAIRNIDRLTGVPHHQMVGYELAHCKHLLCDATGLSEAEAEQLFRP